MTYHRLQWIFFKQQTIEQHPSPCQEQHPSGAASRGSKRFGTRAVFFGDFVPVLVHSSPKDMIVDLPETRQILNSRNSPTFFPEYALGIVSEQLIISAQVDQKQ